MHKILPKEYIKYVQNLFSIDMQEMANRSSKPLRSADKSKEKGIQKIAKETAADPAALDRCLSSNAFNIETRSNDKMKEIVRKTAELLSSANSSEDVTTRKIAENAGINPAMVNYYFGSKDSLLKVSISAMEGGPVADAPLDRSSSRKAMFDRLVNICWTYVQYSRLGLSSDVSSFTKDALETSTKLIGIKGLYDGKIQDEKDADSVFRIVCYLMTASGDPDGFAGYSGVDIRSKNQLRSIVSKQLDILLGDAL